jgi:hypothetical protein
MFSFAPMLIGAGIGALGSTLLGKDPLRGGLLGAGLGSGYGGIKSLMEGGSFLQGAMPFASSSVGGASTGIKLVPELISPTEGVINFVPSAANVGKAGIELSQVPIYGNGTEFGITGLSDYVTGAGTNIMAEAPSWMDKITSQQVGNVIGGANVARQYMQQPRVTAPAGGINRGNPPPATAVQELIAQVKPQQRKRISLLVG